jgi:penicillin-binding protein 1A
MAKTVFNPWKRGDAGSILIVFILGLLIIMLVGSSFLYYVVLRDLPSIAALKDYRPSISTRVYADNNELIDEFYLENRKLIKFSDIPPVVIDAFLSAEDARFFEHRGFDMQSISRAFLRNLKAGRIVQGGSTITQQVAKALYLSPEKSYIRKIKEAVLAYKIDRSLSKKEILNLYLNHIYLGHGAYGIEAASQVYFGKSTRYLNLCEASLLAGLPKAPSNYDPYTNYERSRQRQEYVLTRMVEDGHIAENEKNRVLRMPLLLRSIRPQDKVAAYFIENIRRYIQGKYGSDVLYKEGLEVYTTLDIRTQQAARDAVERGLQELENRQRYSRNVVQGALLCMDARTGAIRAMVGGRDFSKSEFNRATQSRRQPGSAFKPIIYTAAFDRGMTPETQIVDSPLAFEDGTSQVWKPQNFDGQFLGPISLRSALVQSRNIVTIKLLQEIGVNYAIAYAANMGISSPLAPNLSLALGSSAVTLQELVRAYAVLANGGKVVEPFMIKKIVDRTGHVFEEHVIKAEQAIDPRIAYLTTHIMQDVVESGTGQRVKSIGRPVAGKTGTTNDMRDAWFIGFTPSLVTGVWVGFDQERSLGSQEVGGRAAAPIWLYCMEKALANTPIESFPVPEGIVFARQGEGAAPEPFLDGLIPPDSIPVKPEETLKTEEDPPKADENKKSFGNSGFPF